MTTGIAFAGVFTALILLVFSASSFSDTYYVDGNGDDNNPGTISEPWRTIGKANQVLRAGDTVYIRAGTYRETIRPENSGTDGNHITYARYGSEEAIITTGTAVDLRERHYIVVDGLKMLDITQNGGWVNMKNEPGGSSTHNVIKNCYMTSAAHAWSGVRMQNGAHYNKILNNTFIGKQCGYDDLIYGLQGCTYNLIEGNTFQDAVHVAVEFQGRGGDVHHNIVRNNVIRNELHTGLNVYSNADYTLVEGNIITDCGDVCGEDGCKENICGSKSDVARARHTHPGIQVGASNGIYRNNVLANNGHGIDVNSWGPEKLSQHNRVYHNTFYDNYYAIFHNCTGPAFGNVFKNNILYKNRMIEIRRTITGQPNDNYYINNDISGAPIKYDPDGTVDLSHLENKYPDMWHGNIVQDPMFSNESDRDFRLKSDSPMIDAGAFLTKTTDSGKGTVIPVEDARYFMDGWGIIDGDLIQLEGQTQTARVIAIDYDSNAITVDRSLKWDKGQGVSLPYTGVAPDVGAVEAGK